MIDTRRYAPVANIGMHGVSKIDYRRTTRERQNLSSGRENVDFVRQQIHLDMLKKLGRVSGRALQFKQRLQPFVHSDLQVGTAFFAILVQPVRGDSLL